MKKSTYIYLWFWLGIMVILAIISLIVYLKTVIILAFPAAGIVFLIIVIISLTDGKTVVNSQEWGILNVMGKYIGYPLKPGIYYIFPYFKSFKLTNYIVIKQGWQEITVSQNVKFRDRSVWLRFVLIFRIDDIEKATTLITNSTEYLSQYVKYQFLPAVSYLRLFLSQLYLKQAVGIKNLYPLKLAATNILPIDERSIAHLLVDYEIHKSFPLGYNQLRDIINENGARNILPSFKELNRLFSKSSLFANLQEHGISILKMDILGFDEAIKQMDEELKKIEETRIKKEEEERIQAHRKELALTAQAQGKDICPYCYTIEPSRCYCGHCRSCYGYCYLCDDDGGDDDDQNNGYCEGNDEDDGGVLG